MLLKNKSSREKIVIDIAIILLLVSTLLQCKDLFIRNDNYTVNYEYVNIKDMSKANVTTKVDNKNIVEKILTKHDNLGIVEDLSFNKEEEAKVEEAEIPVQNESVASVPERQTWYFPTEIGIITQYPHYGHNAYDITSPRGTGETIHPIANGVISGIYTDNAGALIVTVLHDINGTKYTSQYVHLSSYANGIYVGMPVTINDALGQMGTTGNSTGVHLHLAVLDCELFNPNDYNCSNLGAWYNYSDRRINENFYGLGVLMYVPGEWYSR